MPTSALRPCAGRCGRLVSSGYCSTCRTDGKARGSAHERGYTAGWNAFRARYIDMLVYAGIPPICGAALPDGPQTDDSRCKAAGLIVGEGLHFDHEPTLTDRERSDPSIVCDPTRIQLLCAVDHAIKTRRGR